MAGSVDYPYALAVSGNRIFGAGYGSAGVNNDDWVVRAYSVK